MKFKRFKKRKAFTLIEFVLVIALSGILFLALAQIIIVLIQSWDVALSGTNLIGQTEVALSRMSREIRQIKNRTNLITAIGTDLRFTDINDNDIEYQISGNQLLRNSDVAIDNVNSLLFEYFDRNRTLISSPVVSPSYTDVRLVRMTISVTQSSQSIVLRTLVKLRDVR